MFLRRQRSTWWILFSYWFGKQGVFQLPLRNDLTYNSGKKNLWMKMLSIKGKKVKACHRGKGDKHDQNAMYLTLKEIRQSRMCCLTSLFFFASNPLSKCWKLIFYWWPIINFASIKADSFFFLSCCVWSCFPGMTVETGAQRRFTHEWWVPCNIEHQGLLSKSPFLSSGVHCICT